MSRKIAAVVAAVALVVSLCAGPAYAEKGSQNLSVTWAFLFPIPVPLPVWTVDHPDTTITYGFLFPLWLPLPLYQYDDHGPVQPKFTNLPPDSELYVDGEGAGALAAYEGADPLAGLPDGEHMIRITHEGRTLYAALVELDKGEVVGVRPAPEVR